MSEKSGWKCALAQWGILWVRMALGVIFAAHGLQKVFGLWGGYGLSATVETFTQKMGISAPLAYAAIFTELVGGLALFFGLLTRISALAIAIHLSVAAYKVHWVNGFFMNWFNIPNVGHGIEYNLALFGMALGLLFTGPGAISLDSLLFCKKCCSKEDSASCCAAEGETKEAGH